MTNTLPLCSFGAIGGYYVCMRLRIIEAPARVINSEVDLHKLVLTSMMTRLCTVYRGKVGRKSNRLYSVIVESTITLNYSIINNNKNIRRRKHEKISINAEKLKFFVE